jgi:hypothetical protein
MAALQEPVAQVAADEAGPTGDKDVHGQFLIVVSG